MVAYIDFDIVREIQGGVRANHNAEPQAPRICGEGCDGCHYHRWVSDRGSTGKMCHYCYDTGHSRNCDAGVDCIHYITNEEYSAGKKPAKKKKG